MLINKNKSSISMNENNQKERTGKDLIMDLMKLLIPFALVYLIYILIM